MHSDRLWYDNSHRSARKQIPVAADDCEVIYLEGAKPAKHRIETCQLSLDHAVYQGSP